MDTQVIALENQLEYFTKHTMTLLNHYNMNGINYILDLSKELKDKLNGFTVATKLSDDDAQFIHHTKNDLMKIVSKIQAVALTFDEDATVFAYLIPELQDRLTILFITLIEHKANNC